MYHLKRRFMKHDRCDMKRSPGGLHVFWPLWAKTGRGDWIRTSDLYVPNVALQPD